MTEPDKTDLPYLHLSYQKDLYVLFCRWDRPVSKLQFKEGYKATLQMAAQHVAHFWLLDLRSRNMCSTKQKKWFVNTFACNVHDALNDKTFLAFLVSPLQYECFKSEVKLEQEAVSHDNYLTIRYYTYEHDALEWLQTCRLQKAT